LPARDTERFFTFLDHLPIAALVIVFDDSQVNSLSDQKIRFVNRKFLDLIGYRVEEIPDAQAWMDLAYPDPVYCHEVMQLWKDDAAAALSRDEVTAKATVKVRCKDGLDRWFEAFSEVRSTIQDGYYIISFVDITEVFKTIEGYKKLSSVDQLTGVYNQHYILQRIDQEIERAISSGSGFTLAMADLDFFKVINDRYGTACGDYVLIEIANMFRQQLSGLDSIARWNGNDFVILLREDNPQLARNIIQEVWQAIRARSFEWKSHSFAMTITIGMTGFQVGDQKETIIERVEQALQRGKNVGGDFIYSEDD